MSVGTTTSKEKHRLFKILKIKERGTLVRFRFRGFFLDGIIGGIRNSYFQFGKKKVNYLYLGKNTPKHLRTPSATKKINNKWIMLGTLRKPINIWRGYEEKQQTLWAREVLRTPVITTGYDS